MRILFALLISFLLVVSGDAIFWRTLSQLLNPNTRFHNQDYRYGRSGQSENRALTYSRSSQLENRPQADAYDLVHKGFADYITLFNRYLASSSSALGASQSGSRVYIRSEPNFNNVRPIPVQPVISRTDLGQIADIVEPDISTGIDLPTMDDVRHIVSRVKAGANAHFSFNAADPPSIGLPVGPVNAAQIDSASPNLGDVEAPPNVDPINVANFPAVEDSTLAQNTQIGLPDASVNAGQSSQIVALPNVNLLSNLHHPYFITASDSSSPVSTLFTFTNNRDTRLPTAYVYPQVQQPIQAFQYPLIQPNPRNVHMYFVGQPSLVSAQPPLPTIQTGDVLTLAG